MILNLILAIWMNYKANTIILMIVLLIKQIIVDDGYSSLTENIESSDRAPKFKVDDRVRITKC